VKLPTDAEIEAAHAALACHEHYTLEVSLHIRGNKRLLRAMGDMDRVVARAVALGKIDETDPDYLTLVDELVNSVFATGLAYGLEIADQREAARVREANEHALDVLRGMRRTLDKAEG
jgi:hypothetical protein